MDTRVEREFIALQSKVEQKKRRRSKKNRSPEKILEIFHLPMDKNFAAENWISFQTFAHENLLLIFPSH